MWWLLRSERRQKISSNAFGIRIFYISFLFIWNWNETIPDIRPKWVKSIPGFGPKRAQRVSPISRHTPVSNLLNIKGSVLNKYERQSFGWWVSRNSPRMSIWERLLPAVVRVYAEWATHVQDHSLLAGCKDYSCNCPEQPKLCQASFFSREKIS